MLLWMMVLVLGEGGGSFVEPPPLPVGARPTGSQRLALGITQLGL
jgi:hypothetical protein